MQVENGTNGHVKAAAFGSTEVIVKPTRRRFAAAWKLRGKAITGLRVKVPTGFHGKVTTGFRGKVTTRFRQLTTHGQFP